jgi:hypothetical protein
MNWFLKRLFKFSLPLFIAAGCLEIKLSSIPTSYTYKRFLLQQLQASTEVLIFGTSHAFYDFNPKEFSMPGLNLANVSQSLIIDEQLYEKYRDHFPKLKLIVLNLSYFSFEYRLYGQVDDERNYFYPRYYGIRGDGGLWSFFDLRLLSLSALFGPTVSKRIILSGFKENLAKEVNTYGWFDSSKTDKLSLPITDSAGIGRANFHTSLLDQTNLQLNIKAINRIFDLAKARNVQLVLSQAPAFTTYTNHLNAQARSRFAMNISQLHTSLGLTFFDYLKDARFQKKDFYDNDHLSAIGASKFSRIFDQEVLRPLTQAR